ncbi:MAG: tetratricopeptide repeat protein [Candidatus Omnitrophica bacterium]|nr:tetratricopeptide repeat protein [Candidatus Omnitrophota bacterium]MDD5770979.1 tetratricopeptide repeat protein [Candidatus Omnitrophota bacterium]
MMRRSIACALILSLFLIHPCLAQESPKETELLFMAKKAYEDGFYEVALGMLERFRKEYPGSVRNGEVRLLMGQSYFHQGRYPEALSMLEGLLTDPGISGFKDAIYFWIAEIYFKEGNFDKAIGFYLELIDDFPRSSFVPAAYYSLGWSYSQTGRYREALDSLKSLLESFPSEPQSKDAAFKLMECLYNLKEYSELKVKIKSVLRLYANDPLRLPYLYFYLAESEYYLDDLAEAAKDYLKAAQSFQDKNARALANLGLGWSYLKTRRYDEAGEVFSGIRQEDLDKKGLDVLILGQAVLMSQTNRAYEARKFYEQLLELSEDHLIRLQAYIGKAEAFCNLAEYGHAIKVYKEGLAKADSRISGSSELTDKMRYSLGLAYAKQGEVESAVSAFKEAAERSPDAEFDAGALCRAGDIYQDGGDYREAAEVYAGVLKKYPASSFADYALYQKGLAQLKDSDYESAIASFRLLEKDYPQSKFLEDAAYSLGAVYFDRQDYASSVNALSVFQNKFKTSPLASQAVFTIGLGMLNSGKINEALDIFKDIVRRFPQEAGLKQRAEYEIADCYYKLGQEKEALKRFKILRVKYPDSKLTPEIMWWLGKYYYRLNDLDLSSRYFSSLAKEYPESSLAADALYALGLIRRRENDFDKAIANFESVLKLEGGGLKTEAALAIADIYFQEGRTEEALKEYRQLLKLHPDSGRLIFPRLAKCYFRSLDYGQAEAFFKKALELAETEDIDDLRFSLAEVYESDNKMQEAADIYLKIADAPGSDRQLSARALLRCAKIREDKDDFRGALEAYEKVPLDDSEESKFARERVEWIRANIK